jgi:tetratricopeptide (TPR) repeat protein
MSDELQPEKRRPQPAEESVESFLNTATDLLRNGLWGQAAAVYSECIRMNPDCSPAYLGRGRCAAQMRRFGEAIEDYDAAADLDPDSADPLFYRAVSLLALGRSDAALADLNRSLELQPDLAEAYCTRAGQFVRLGREQEAINDCNEAIRLQPDSAEAYYQRYLVYSKLGRADQAQGDLDEAIQMGKEVEQTTAAPPQIKAPPTQHEMNGTSSVETQPEQAPSATLPTLEPSAASPEPDPQSPRPPKEPWWLRHRKSSLVAVSVLMLGSLTFYAYSHRTVEPRPPLRPAGPRSVFVAPEARTSFENEKKFAVVVGIDKYPPESGFRQLQFAAADAVAMADELHRQGYEVKRLIDSEAVRESVRSALANMARVSQRAQGTLIFYFAGHGGQTSKGQYLATFETSVKTFSDAALPLHEVEETLTSAPAPRKVMFIDACRNDPTLNPTRGSRGEIEGFSWLASSRGVRILNSAEKGQTSSEDPDRKHGFFTFALIEGLQGKAAGPDGLITFDDLANYAWTRVPELTFERSLQQTPYAAGEFSGDFLIAKKAKDSPVARQP